MIALVVFACDAYDMWMEGVLDVLNCLGWVVVAVWPNDLLGWGFDVLEDEGTAGEVQELGLWDDGVEWKGRADASELHWVHLLEGQLGDVYKIVTVVFLHYWLKAQLTYDTNSSN